MSVIRVLRLSCPPLEDSKVDPKNERFYTLLRLGITQYARSDGPNTRSGSPLVTIEVTLVQPPDYENLLVLKGKHGADIIEVPLEWLGNKQFQQALARITKPNAKDRLPIVWAVMGQSNGSTNGDQVFSHYQRVQGISGEHPRSTRVNV